MTDHPVKVMCGARLRGREGTCRQPPARGRNRCRNHGGATLQGSQAPSFQHGRYSKHLPERLLHLFQASATDHQLLDLRAEISLVDSRTSELLQRLETSPSETWLESLRSAWSQYEAASRSRSWTDQEEAKLVLADLIESGPDPTAGPWREINAQLEQRRKLVLAEARRQEQLQTMISAEQALSFVAAVIGAVRRHVDEADKLRAISAEIDRLLGAGSREIIDGQAVEVE